jgi:ubiquinone/menaquinone biosynthesis C-methylase UbiE
MSAENRKPHYGYYALPIFATLIVIIIAVGMLVSVFVSQVAGIIILSFGVYMFSAYGISMHLAKQSRAADIPDIMQIRGDEKALDVGCGLGKTTVGVAKHLTTGRVVGVDIWDKMEILGNSPERAYENAKLEGVLDKVEFKTANVLSLPFPNNSFDLVTSSSVINNLHDDAEKLKALAEVFRVLRPGGKFLMMEPLRNLRGFFTFSPFAFLELLTKDKWIQMLDETKFVQLRCSYESGMEIFLVEKPL